MQYKNLTIEKINHAAVVARGSKIVYFDPLMLGDGLAKADLVLVSHEHFDHCSVGDIKKVIGPETVVIAIQMCAEALKDIGAKEVRVVKPGDALEVGGVKIEAVPAYNINKFGEPGVPFHPKQDGKVGFVVEMDGVRVYHAGDTDDIPEMANLKNIDVALVPVSGIFTMTAEEAAEAVKVINPKVAIPIHCGDFAYQGNSIGTQEDKERFKRLSSVPVEF
jgi:L-ascorbate metabolism protein UlaG (beta-lactamase superfamily)